MPFVLRASRGETEATPRTYVDNWGWTVRSVGRHRKVLEVLSEVESSLRLVVDWSKAYVFATCRQARKWLKQHSLDLFGTHVPLVVQTKELGTHLQFSRHCTLGMLPDRFQEASRRLHRLFHSPATLEQKALVVQNSIWPFAMFGSYSLAPGRTRSSTCGAWRHEPYTAGTTRCLRLLASFLPLRFWSSKLVSCAVPLMLCPLLPLVCWSSLPQARLPARPMVLAQPFG